jgi:DNA-binding MarR family transcriptional regulator/predicted GNAT family N-acyltransferase
MDFFNKVGKTAIGSRLRMLTERITEDAAHIYQLYDIDMQPKWFPVFYVLSKGEEKTITSIAKEIGQSHPSVSKIISEMSEKKIVMEKKDAADGRKNLVSLSKKGIEITLKIQDQYTDVSTAIEEISGEATNDLWKAMEEWEFLLEQSPLLNRVKKQQKQREGQKVKIVAYEPKYQEAFKALNEEWISAYFKLEEADHKALDNPEGYIIEKGGYILIALYNEEPAGTCALLKMNDPEYDFELAKMAVSTKLQGKNIGWLLGQAALNKAVALGAKKIYLESNTSLKPAINLYHKLGFKKIVGHTTPYERCNIQMAVELK